MRTDLQVPQRPTHSGRKILMPASSIEYGGSQLALGVRVEGRAPASIRPLGLPLREGAGRAADSTAAGVTASADRTGGAGAAASAGGSAAVFRASGGELCACGIRSCGSRALRKKKKEKR